MAIEETMHDDVAAAFDEVMGGGEEAAPAEVEAPPEAEVEAAPEGEAEVEEAPERARDESGRFAKAPKEKAAAPKGTEKPAAETGAAKGKAAGVTPPAPAAAPPPEPLKVPQSWKPQMRELAAKLPPEFRPIVEEALRRDGEVNRALQESAQARQVAQTVQGALAPFEGIARMAGKDAWAWAGEALQQAAVLQQGNPQQQIEFLANYIRSRGVDVQALANALDGQPTQPHSAPAPVDVESIVNRRLEAVMQQAEVTRAQHDAQAFLATNPEFIRDVGPEMGAIIRSMGQGQNIDLKAVYDRACWMNPDVRAILQQRQDATKAKAAAEAAAKARAAGRTSVRPSPAPAAGKPASAGKGKVDDDVRAAIEELEAAG